MNANLRAILTAIAGFAAVLFVIWGVDRGIIQPAFVALEQDQAREDSERARAAIQGELRQLDQKLGDWAEWDDAYAFIESRDPAFIQSNLGSWRVLEKGTHLNLCVILDRQGHRLYAGGYDSDLGGAVVPAAFSDDPPAIWSAFVPRLEREEGRAGLWLTEHGLLAVAARPILTTQGTGPARGLLLFGRFLDESLQRTLSQQTQVAFDLLAAGDPRLESAERAYLTTLRAGAPALRPGPGGVGFVYEVLLDLADQPVGLLRTPVRQAISATARHTSRTLVGALGLVTLILLLGHAVWSNRIRQGEVGSTAAAWGTATLATLIGVTLTSSLHLELYRRGQLAPDDFTVQLLGGAITLLLALYLFVLVARRQAAERLVAARTLELQASEERYRIVALMTGQMIYDYDCLTGQIQWAGAIADITGQDAETYSAVAIDAWAERIYPEDRPEALDRLHRAMEAGAHYAVEYRFAQGNGTYRWIEDHGAFLLDGGGRAVRMLGTMQDVTERHQAEMSLLQRDHLLQAVADAMTRLLSGHDLEETIGAALATLGQAVAADRVYIFENHADPVTGVLLMSQRYEWCAAAAIPEIDNPALQNLPYDAWCPRWYSTLGAGGAIEGLVREFPESERAALELQAIRSILVLSIQINDQFWGFIGFDDCHTDRRWTPVEQNILRTAAAALGHAYVRRRTEAALRASERRFRAMIDHAPDGILLFNNTIRYASPAIERILGYTPTEATALDTNRLTHPEDLPSLESLFNDLQGQTGRVVTTQYRFRHKDGSWRWLESTISNLLSEPSVAALVFNFRDITDRWHAEERQRLAAAVFEVAREAIFVADAEGRILAVNPAFTLLTGYVETEVLGRTPRLMWADRQPEAFFQDMMQTVAHDGVWQGEFWARRQDGGRRAALASLCVVRDVGGQITRYVGVATDITAQRAAEQRIEHLAYYDALTELPNRGLLAQRAELALALAARHGQTLAVLFLDMDRFKEVNDALGHIEGDTLLVQVASRLRALIRAEDTVSRLGGDEFVLLLPEADQEGALRVADKVLDMLRQPFTVAGHGLNVTASVGIALYPNDGANFAELLKNADVALYRAKHEGGNTRAFYDRAMHAATLARMVLEAELRQALAVGQLCAHYQPQVRLADGVLVGAEALVRWQHPERGLIPPAQFVPVAEASDLIVALGEWMLGEVCRQLAAWQRHGWPRLTVSINLAARHFRQPGFADRIRELLEAYGLPAEALELELTETTLLDASAVTVETLRQLERQGIGLVLDDFGIGYSSLSYLKLLPLTALKIDQRFVRDLVVDPEDRAIAATIVSLGHHLSLVVAAEGVETEEQRRLLLEQGCDLAQGHLFGQALPAEAFAAAWLAPAGARLA